MTNAYTHRRDANTTLLEPFVWRETVATLKTLRHTQSLSSTHYINRPSVILAANCNTLQTREGARNTRKPKQAI